MGQYFVFSKEARVSLIWQGNCNKSCAPHDDIIKVVSGCTIYFHNFLNDSRVSQIHGLMNIILLL